MMKILVGIPSTRRDERFIDSVQDFYRTVRKHELSFLWVHNKRLAEAQNEIAEAFLGGDSDYLLFLDDDHWGHTAQMLDILIGAQAMVATIRTFSRHYPYSCALLKKAVGGGVFSVEQADGYQEMDLTGFPMTLISRDLFAKIERPFFRETETCGRDWNTDIEFFERLEKVNVKPVGCFQHTLNHDKITPENVFEYRYQERLRENNIALFRLFRDHHGV